MTNRISCDAHDYFEIVCMRRSQIVVTTDNNEIYNGVAHGISIIEHQEMLQIKAYNIVHDVLLTEIKQLQAIGNNIATHNFSIQWKL